MTDLETRLRTALAVQVDAVEAHLDGPGIRRAAGRRRLPGLPPVPSPAGIAAGIVVATAIVIALVVLALAPPQRHHVIHPGGPLGTVTSHHPSVTPRTPVTVPALPTGTRPGIARVPGGPIATGSNPPAGSTAPTATTPPRSSADSAPRVAPTSSGR